MDDKVVKRLIHVEKQLSSQGEELDDYRESINQNTNEIQALYDYLYELDSKIEKVSERIAEIHMLLAPSCSIGVENVKLTSNEQEVFLMIYSFENPISVSFLAKKLGMSVDIVERYIASLRLKGIPLLSQFIDGDQYISLEMKFKDLQARKNILRIPQSARETISKSFNHN